MIEHLNIINSLDMQICALLDLMMCTGAEVNITSINTAASMCLTMRDDLMAEVNKIEKEWREGSEDLHG